MLFIGRFSIKELSAKRLLGALKTRIKEIPHTAAWYIHPFSKENKKRIKNFKGIHKGRRCFIVANGPSLKETDLTLLNNEITIGLNRIYLLFNENAFRPTYLVTVNELILEQFSKEICQLEMPKFLNWNRRNHYNISDSNMSFIKSKMVIKDSFGCDIAKPIVTGATVTFVALQIAYYMGFQQVILIGLDHNYAEKGNPSETEVRTDNVDRSHFHPQYFPKGVKWQPPDLLRSEIEFAIARKVFESSGREVIDATLNGKCQIFKKGDYLSLFNTHPKNDIL